MPLQKFLGNTLQGDVRPMVTECTLARIMAEASAAHGGKVNNAPGGMGRQGQRSRPAARPEYLPPPTELPLRYCKHETQREEMGDKWTEADCLVDLVGGMARGGEQKKNHWHYVLATADEEGLDSQQQQQQQTRRKGPDVRERARLIPGVPIVYVKRSVMVLEEMSGASERWTMGREKEKLREGIVGKKRKRPREDGEEEDPADAALEPQDGAPKAARGTRKAKGPNPLSALKKKEKKTQGLGDGANGRSVEHGDDTAAAKAKRRRKHNSATRADAQDVPNDAVTVAAS